MYPPRHRAAVPDRQSAASERLSLAGHHEKEANGAAGLCRLLAEAANAPAVSDGGKVIGVACKSGEEPFVEEFFEFFKTPWEFCRPGCAYPVLVSTCGRPKDSHAQVLILYGSDPWEEFAGELLHYDAE